MVCMVILLFSHLRNKFMNTLSLSQILSGLQNQDFQNAHKNCAIMKNDENGALSAPLRMIAYENKRTKTQS